MTNINIGDIVYFIDGNVPVGGIVDGVRRVWNNEHTEFELSVQLDGYDTMISGGRLFDSKADLMNDFNAKCRALT